MPQITTARLQAIDRQWRSLINKYRGPIPAGLAVAHIVAESNGAATPIVRDAKRSIGMMRIPTKIGLQNGYKEIELKKPLVSLYVWCVQTNKDSKRQHTTYPTMWPQANYDYWLSLRLVFTLGFINFDNLAVKVLHTAAPGALTSAIQTWIRSEMSPLQRFGTFRARDLLRIADELDWFRTAMNTLDGPNRVSALFHKAPELNPGGDFETMRVMSF